MMKMVETRTKTAARLRLLSRRRVTPRQLCSTISIEIEFQQYIFSIRKLAIPIDMAVKVLLFSPVTPQTTL